MEAGTLTIEEAAGRLGLHYMTVYRYVRIGRLPAEYRDGRWQIDPGDLALLGRSKSSRGMTGERGERRSESLEGSVERMLDRLLAGDGAGAWLIVENALLGGSPGDVYLQILAPCLRAIGDGWESGRLSIADEHRATAITLGMVGRLGPLFGRRGRRRAGCVLLAGAEGDSHVIPLIMVADLLKAAGHNVVQLGADVPTDTLVAMAVAADLSAIGLSASTGESRARAGRAILALHRRVPGVPVLLGGPAVPSEQDALTLGADGWAADARTAAELVTRLERRP